MPKKHTVADLASNQKIYYQKLTTDILQDFYEQYFVPKAYIFKVSNNNMNDTIQLIFDNDQFCHLIGFSYFGYNGINGWMQLRNNPLPVSTFEHKPKFNLLLQRIQNFGRIFQLLNSPDIYIYNAADFKQYSYKSKYFAIYKDLGRVFKLGIGQERPEIHYAETYIVDLDKPQYNSYLIPNNLLNIDENKTLSKADLLQLIKETRESSEQEKPEGYIISPKEADLTVVSREMKDNPVLSKNIINITETESSNK